MFDMPSAHHTEKYGIFLLDFLLIFLRYFKKLFLQPHPIVFFVFSSNLQKELNDIKDKKRLLPQRRRKEALIPKVPVPQWVLHVVCNHAIAGMRLKHGIAEGLDVIQGEF